MSTIVDWASQTIPFIMSTIVGWASTTTKLMDVVTEEGREVETLWQEKCSQLLPTSNGQGAVEECSDRI